MRIIVKGADFSNVSIGKVIKDLSFNYNTLQQMNSLLANPVDDLSLVDPTDGFAAGGRGGGHNGSATYYGAESGDSQYQSATNEYRFISNLIEVTEGMVITYTAIDGSSSLPTFICYSDENTLIVPPVAYWGSFNGTYTIPAGVKYIRFQCAHLYSYATLKGDMPE